MKYETSLYSQGELETARKRGQIKGFAQGVGATILALLALKLVGWVPAVLALVLAVAVGLGVVKRIRKAREP